jgi:hypothetical protein
MEKGQTNGTRTRQVEQLSSQMRACRYNAMGQAKEALDGWKSLA